MFCGRSLLRAHLFPCATACLLGLSTSQLSLAQQSSPVNPASVSSQLTTTKSLLLETSSMVEMDDDAVVSDEQAQPEELPLEVPPTQASEVGDVELVQQLHPNGSLKVAKHVKLDESGNYVSHGEYQEWAESGELRMSGHFNMGKRDGLWIRFCQTKESKLLETEPYKKFKAPFQSTAEFVDGKLHGVWAITDKDGKKISEIQLSEGKRSGIATWYHSNGSVLWQSEYKNGLLDGVFTEKDASGKVTRQTHYIQGQKAEKNTEYYANKKRKLEFQFLTAAQVPVTLDDWSTTTLATYDIKGTEVKHGTFTVYYENGSVRSQVSYNQGVQEGAFVGFFPNNQREVVGTYSAGKQHGKWSWWHENGMRKAVANYEHGVIVESALAWNDKGERIEANELPRSLPVSTPAPLSTPAPAANPTPSNEQSTSNSSRSASNSRRSEKQ